MGSRSTVNKKKRKDKFESPTGFKIKKIQFEPTQLKTGHLAMVFAVIFC
jgi:hypothetical protein